MSDFIFSRSEHDAHDLAGCIRAITAPEAMDVDVFHGPWGALAVSRNPYRGFEPYENDRAICAVIGRPVLVLASGKPTLDCGRAAGTRTVFEHLRAGDTALRVSDLSGPLAVLVVDKTAGDITVITDLLSLVPVYEAKRAGIVYLGTHVDALASAAHCRNDIDHASIADFIMSGVVTFPHTTYSSVRQLDPATIYVWPRGENDHPRLTNYWLPREETAFDSIDSAAAELRAGLIDYVDRVTPGMDKVACLASSGEDARAVLAILARHTQADAVTFVPALNFDARVVQECAAAFGAEYKPVLEGQSLLLEDFETVSRLIGSTAEARHTRFHSLYRQAGIRGYDGVFGGYLSDTLLKCGNLKKIKLPPLTVLPDVRRPVARPWLFDLEDTRSFDPDMVDTVMARRKQHYDRIRGFRPKSAADWFTFWPMTQECTMAYWHANRRLFPSYEPCMAARVIRVAAGCPISWKLNRRLFQKAVQPLLIPVKWALHTKGRMPYFSSLNPFAQSVAHLRFAIAQLGERNTPAAQNLRTEFERNAAWDELRQMATDMLGPPQARIERGIRSAFPDLAIRSKLRVVQIARMLHRDVPLPRAA